MRNILSKKYIPPHSVGLEIAAFHNPWPVPERVHVIYLDILTNPELRRHFPEMDHKLVVNIHVLDDANVLQSIPDGSMDFVINSHVLEHMENVGIAIRNWLRVLKPKGHLLMAIPLNHNEIDKKRTPTSLEHVLMEYHNYPTFDYYAHYLEYYRDGKDQLRELALDIQTHNSVISKPNIHFHCWDLQGLKDLFHTFKTILKYETKEITEAGHEAFVILQKN